MIFRLKDFVYYPLAIKSFRNFLSESQYWSADKRKSWVQEKLERTLNHAVENVPYYKRALAPFRSRFNDMIDRLDLRELPVLTKEEIRNHYDELCAENLHEFRTNETQTSGSTGTPTKFLLDADSNVSHFASLWRVLNWVGYRFGDKFADMTGFMSPNGGLFEYDIRLNCLHLSSFDFKKENMALYVEKLKKFNPVLIKAYPSAIDLFSRWLRESGITGYHPKVVLTCAETLLDHQKATIEEVLQCPVFDFYNQNERAALFSTCEKGNYHVHEEYSFVEFVSDPNRVNKSESTKSIVTTSLHNLAMPLIRYQTNDLSLSSGEKLCSCGRTYRTLQKIIGRVEDIVVTPDGRCVGRLDAAFKYSSGVRLSQIIQDTVNKIQVKIVKSPQFEQPDIDNIERELRARLGQEIRIEYDFVDSILPGRNGKVKFVISKPGKELLANLN